jgi:hypothetical protein
MPLIKPVLETQILAAFQRMSNSTKSMDEAQKELAKDLATAIDAYIKSATIITPPGTALATAVVTAGSAVAQTGAGTGATIAPTAPAIIS